MKDSIGAAAGISLWLGIVSLGFTGVYHVLRLLISDEFWLGFAAMALVGVPVLLLVAWILALTGAALGWLRIPPN